MATQKELDRLNGKHEGDILLLARQWADAARRHPPMSGLFLADDLDRIANGIERMRAERLKLDRRIHNQRRANRDTWETVEMRRKSMGSDVVRRAYAALLKRYQKLLRVDGQEAPAKEQS